jgi:uncharacterized protein YbjT (DUF2867 family)
MMTGLVPIRLRVIVFGATGMVGEGVLHEALLHPAVDAALVVGRRRCGVTHPKLRELLLKDFYDYSSCEEQLRGYNACFFCLGVSSVGMKELDYRHVTYDLTLAAAKILVRLNPGMTFCYVSGTGTDSTGSGKRMWARVKGSTENDLMKLPFKAVYAFRPGFIKPIRGLKNAYRLSVLLGGMYPVWKSLLPNYVCTLEDLGIAMIRSATDGYGKTILENKDIEALAHGIDHSSTIKQ